MMDAGKPTTKRVANVSTGGARARTPMTMKRKRMEIHARVWRWFDPAPTSRDARREFRE